MTLALSAAVKLARSTAVRVTIDGAATAGKLNMYSAPRPASGAAPTGSTLLASLTFDDPCGTVDNAGLHLVATVVGQGVAAGVVNWARITDGDGVWVMDADVRQFDAVDVLAAEFVIDVAQMFPGAFVNLVQPTTLSEG